MTIDKVRCLGGQKHRGTNQILGGAPTTGQCLTDDKLVKGMAAAITLSFTQRSGLGGSNATRAQVATILMNFCKLLAK